LPIANGGTGTTSTTFANLTTNVTGTLPVANGGTGVTTSTGTGSVVLSASPTFTGTPLSTTAALNTNTTQIATTAFVQSQIGAIAAGVSSFSAGTTGFTPSTATTGAVTLAGTLATTNGGTGLTSFTSGGVVYASSTSALATGSALTFDGSKLTVTGTIAPAVGAISTPSIRHTTNAATGMWFPTANQLAFSANGAQNLTITPSGISVAGTVGLSIGVAGNNTTTSLNWGTNGTGLYGDATTIASAISGTEVTRLTSTGLGIGTSSPLFKLQSNGTVARKYVTAGTSGSPAEEAGFIYADDTSTPVAGMWFYNAFSSNSATQLSFKTRTSGGTVTEAIRIDASQNVGVGTTSAISKIHVFKSSGNQLQLQSDNTGTSTIDMGGTTTPARGGIRFDDNDGSLNLRTNSTTQVTLSNAGNLGLGVTPSAWGSSYKAIQNLKTSWFGTTSRDLNLGSNVFYDGTNYKYIDSSFASNYIQYQSAHSWYIAPTGTAGNTITFTQAMTLDASGNLLVGVTSGSARLTVSSGEVNLATFASTRASGSYMTLNLGTSGTTLGFIGHAPQAIVGASNNQLGIRAETDLLFATGGSTERVRIDSVGNVLVGGTAARGTTVGTKHLDLFDGTAPAGTLTNGVSLYSSSGDLRFMDSAGNAYSVGYRNIPQSGSSKTASYTLATTDVGEYILLGASGAIVIPDATFAAGDVITIFNNTASTATITCSITTAYIAGTFTDKATMTLAAAGVATVLFITSTLCVVNGNVS
jgi:hypothetical protein